MGCPKVLQDINLKELGLFTGGVSTSVHMNGKLISLGVGVDEWQLYERYESQGR